MDKKIFLLFSHELTDGQVNELKEKYYIEKFVNLPEELQKLWSNFPPENEFPIELADKFISFLQKNSISNDYVLVQGDFGLVYYIVNWCLKNNRIAIYSTTKRIFKEEKLSDGSIKNIHIFKHVNFRKYIKEKE